MKTTWGATPSLVVTGPVDAAGAPFNGELCTAFLPITLATSAALGVGARPCVPQPMPAATDANGAPYTPVDYWLDGVSDRLMYRVAYRNFGDHESLVLNHTVNASAHQAGVRWYELRNPGTTPTLVQQSTYTGAAPNLDHRFMALGGDGQQRQHAGRLHEDQLDALPRDRRRRPSGQRSSRRPRH